MNTTLVSCYYRFKSKHSPEEYLEWINNLFQSLSKITNMIIFSSNDQSSVLRKLADAANLKNTLVLVKEIEDFSILNDFPMSVWENQYEIDKWKYSGRTKECYIIWNSKMRLLKEAMEINPFGSQTFVWNDIGSLRSPFKLNSYPSNVSKDELDIVMIAPYQSSEQMYFQNEIHLSASLFGGGIEPIKFLHDKYYECMKDYIDKGLFVGCDQQILSTLLMQYPEKFNIVIPQDQSIDPWFYMYKYYTSTHCIPGNN